MPLICIDNPDATYRIIIERQLGGLPFESIRCEDVDRANGIMQAYCDGVAAARADLEEKQERAKAEGAILASAAVTGSAIAMTKCVKTGPGWIGCAVSIAAGGTIIVSFIALRVVYKHSTFVIDYQEAIANLEQTRDRALDPIIVR